MKAMGAALAVLMLLGTPALALTITNNDDIEHAITVIAGEEQNDYNLAPGGTAEDACNPSCSILMDESEEGFDATAADQVSISSEGELTR
jgi:hypothetical protein